MKYKKVQWLGFPERVGVLPDGETVSVKFPAAVFRDDRPSIRQARQGPIRFSFTPAARQMLIRMALVVYE